MANFASQVVVALAGALASAPLCALEIRGNIITLTAEELDGCESNGGCLVIPRAVLIRYIEQMTGQAYEAGKSDANTTCPNKT